MVPPLTVSPNYVRKTNNVELETSESYSSAINAKFRKEEAELPTGTWEVAAWCSVMPAKSQVLSSLFAMQRITSSGGVPDSL